uniref:Transmembrane protein n=1 Tax=Salarias fasciatus TaxID=181472 RepID=A0A672FJ96_SALFA
MRSQSWIRRNWFWAAGGAFVGVHMLTWVLQKAMKHSVRSEASLKRQPEDQGDGHRPL